MAPTFWLCAIVAFLWHIGWIDGAIVVGGVGFIAAFLSAWPHHQPDECDRMGR